MLLDKRPSNKRLSVGGSSTIESERASERRPRSNNKEQSERQRAPRSASRSHAYDTEDRGAVKVRSTLATA